MRVERRRRAALSHPALHRTCHARGRTARGIRDATKSSAIKLFTYSAFPFQFAQHHALCRVAVGTPLLSECPTAGGNISASAVATSLALVLLAGVP